MRVLLADDHALFLEGLQNLLTCHDITVVGTAADGLEALAKARALRPDVIFMDIQMPRCDGLAATRLIKAELPEIKIIMLTMSADDQDLFEAVKSGASGYLLKRLRADEFFDCLSALQAGRTPFSSGLGAKILDHFAHLAGGRRNEGASSSPPAEMEQAQGAGLTPRQLQVLTLVAQGQTYRGVAEALGLSERTIKYHMAEILDQLHLQNRSQVIAYAGRLGLWAKPPTGS